MLLDSVGVDPGWGGVRGKKLIRIGDEKE